MFSLSALTQYWRQNALNCFLLLSLWLTLVSLRWYTLILQGPAFNIICKGSQVPVPHTVKQLKYSKWSTSWLQWCHVTGWTAWRQPCWIFYNSVLEFQDNTRTKTMHCFCCRFFLFQENAYICFRIEYVSLSLEISLLHLLRQNWPIPLSSFFLLFANAVHILDH